MLLVSEVAFARMDQRLAKLLLTHAASDSSDGGNLHVTHQELAAELGTAREVVSRILRSFADQGLVTVSRGHVRLIDEQALRGLLPEGP
jgi:CRP/FNR family transcriptional regulator